MIKAPLIQLQVIADYTAGLYEKPWPSEAAKSAFKSKLIELVGAELQQIEWNPDNPSEGAYLRRFLVGFGYGPYPTTMLAAQHAGLSIGMNDWPANLSLSIDPDQVYVGVNRWHDVIWTDDKQPFNQAVLEVVKLKALGHPILRAPTELRLWEDPSPPQGAALPSACIQAERIIEGQRVSVYAVFRMTHSSEYNAWRSSEPAYREAIVHRAADEITARLAAILEQN